MEVSDRTQLGIDRSSVEPAIVEIYDSFLRVLFESKLRIAIA